MRHGTLVPATNQPGERSTVSLPALVEPAESLTPEEIRRYSRHLIIPDVAMDGQKRLKNAKVLCVGAGGLGSPALMYLAAAGVGPLRIIDLDLGAGAQPQRAGVHGAGAVRPAQTPRAPASGPRGKPPVRR